jgi:hypothetical protein
VQRIKSPYRATKIGIAVRLAEIACERMAAERGVTLGPGFFNTDSWRQIYANQLTTAKFLTKLYDPEAVYFAFLECKNARSLRAPFLDSVIQRKQKELKWLREMADKEDQCDSIVAGHPDPDWNPVKFLAPTGVAPLPKSLASKLNDL